MKKWIVSRRNATLVAVEDGRCTHGRFLGKCPHGCGSPEGVRTSTSEPRRKANEPSCRRCGGSLRGAYGYIGACPTCPPEDDATRKRGAYGFFS